MPPTPDLIGTAEAAQIIGVERSTLTRWVQTDRIAVAIKLPAKNGTVLFDRAEVDRAAADYAAERAARASAPAAEVVS